MISLIIFLIILSVLVVVHELGHFLVARWGGVKVNEFGIGYPPRARKLFHLGGTLFTLNWLPFGGFVKIEGEDSTFRDQNRAVQAAVLVAGVVFNILFAFVLLMIVYGVKDGFATSLDWTGETAKGLAQFILQAFTGQANLNDVSGPIGIVSFVGLAAEYGWRGLVEFTALISINLAFINLLPIPALDGGRLLFVIIESITRKKVPVKVFNLVNTIGFALLIILMLVVTFHDVKVWVE